MNESIKINENNMKFDVIVGNPPYQQKDGGAQASAKPIYNQFVDIAQKLNPSCISMIMPTRWYAGGKGLDAFRDKMINDIHISELHDFLKPELIFPNINLRGGICYFLWDKEYNNTNNLTKVLTYQDNLTPNINRRSLKTEDSDIFIRHGLAVEILKKIKSHVSFESFKSNISAWIDNYKVYTARANNIGTELNDDNLNTFVGNPNTICTESYIVVGVDLELDKLSASNLCKYFTTKFCRFQHSVGKASQDATSKTYIQNFNSKSDIDWNNGIEEIDNQLYKKYGLTDEEIQFIETMIKPMA